MDGPGGRPSWWLANSLGFLVDDDGGQPVGVVEEIQMDFEGHPRALVVVQGWGRRSIVIPIEAIVEIAPTDRRLTVVRGEYPPPATAR